MAEIKDTATLEAQALRFYLAGEEIKKLVEERQGIKSSVGALMKISNQDEYRFGLDPLFDLKIKISDRKNKIFDKQELANDLGVAESAINLEFLLQAVENGKLSFARFRQYCHQEFVENVAIRKVNAD